MVTTLSSIGPRPHASLVAGMRPLRRADFYKGSGKPCNKDAPDERDRFDSNPIDTNDYTYHYASSARVSSSAWGSCK